jgi:class 3 adenylate cyclase/tetratricopeptide (TPR) repeat protein
MKCPACAHDNPAETKFCGECGARLVARCPGCSAANPPGNKFCGECGAPLAAAPAAVPPAPTRAAPAAERFASPHAYTPKHLAEKILNSRSAIEGERKQVTVLFTDVSGFTAMSERLDPEEVHAIMDRGFEVILDAVHHYEGTINQFLGDGVMALFGAPIAHEDHAHRALSAALAIQEGLAPVRAEVRRAHGVEYRVRIGINTGLVVVGAIGRDLRMDYTAVGDTTNLAARMLNLAQPGQIMTTAHTHRLTEGFFVVEDLGEFSVKGKSEPVRGYAVTREIRGRTRLEVSRARGLTPLRGREAELTQLRGAFERAAAGRGGVVLVNGDPGVGKSRLLYEFLSGLAGVGRHRELESTCVSYGRSIPYHPIIDLVRRDLGLLEGGDHETVREACAARLRELGLGAEPDATTLLAHFVGVPAPPDVVTRLGAQLKERTLALLCEWMVRASAAEPLVVVVENVHWSDPSTEEFLNKLIPLVFAHSLLLVLTTRPESAAAWSLPVVTRLNVGGLGVDEAAGMIAALLGAGGVSPQLLDLFVSKSEGNPLYVEEILRQLQETSGVVVEDGEARLSRPDVTVPETVRDIIAARVDRLDEPLKQTLQGAAVVGRQFGAALLARLFEGDEPGVLKHLESLQNRDFVFLLEQLLYSFKHALTQEVVYAGLLERRRRVYHAVVAGGLEELYADRLDEVVEVLAHHFGRSAEQEKAVDYAILAGEKAQRSWANTEALAHFESALKRLDTMEDTEANRRRRIDAVLKQAETKFALGRHAEEIDALEAIKEMVETSADPPRRAAWYYWAGFLHSLTGAPARVSIDYCQRASEIADAGGFTELRAYAECCLAHVYLVAGELHGALKAGEVALEVFEARGNLWWACRTLWALLPVTNALGDWGRALAYCDRAIDHATTVDDVRLRVVAHIRRAVTEVYRGDIPGALAACERAAELQPGPFDAAMLKATRAFALVRGADIGRGTAELEEVMAWFDRSSLKYTRSFPALWLAEAYVRQGQAERACHLAEDVLESARERGYRHVEGIAQRTLGEALFARHGHDSGHLDAAATTLADIGSRNELARTFVALARRAEAAGDATEARRLLERALALFEECGTLDEPPCVHAALAALPPA